MFGYQFVKQRTNITDAVIEWLYEHSSGVTSVVITLIHDAQEIAILNGKEVLNLETLNEAYLQRLSLLHGYIQPTIIHGKQTSKQKKKKTVEVSKAADNENMYDRTSITALVTKAKNESRDIVQLLKEYMTVVEVMI